MTDTTRAVNLRNVASIVGHTVVAPRRLIRSETPALFSAADVERAVGELGVSLVVDLRGPGLSCAASTGRAGAGSGRLRLASIPPTRWNGLMGVTTWDGVAAEDRLASALAHLPDVTGALGDARDVARQMVPATLLDPCRALAASLLAGLPAEQLPSERTEALAACLAFTEHFVLDVAAMPDAVAERVVAALGPQETADFTQALLVEEQRIRLALAFGRLGIGER